MPIRGRFAPSPSGALHVGNLRTALASWLSAKSAGGSWVIRIEDVDLGRSRPAVAEDHLRDLASLGLESDGPVLWQSRRGERYRAALEALSRAGKLYPCRCTRKDLALLASAPHEEDGLRPYPGTCRGRRLEGLQADALRFLLPEGSVTWQDLLWGEQADDPARLTGDPLLHRRDGCYAYHLAVVVDDGDQGVTEVVRGADLRSVTSTQIRLQEALGFPRPRYAHLGLVLGQGGQRLGKRDGALGRAVLEARGVAPSQLIGWLGWSLGCLERPEPCAASDLIARFHWSRVPSGPIQVPTEWGRD